MATPIHIQSVTIEALHGHKNLHLNFRAGLNVIYGRNGSGKTTLLHILANLLYHDFTRFCFLSFRSITISTSAPAVLVVRQEHPAHGPPFPVSVELDGKPLVAIHPNQGTGASTFDQPLLERLGPPPVYLPAFRSILDATDRNTARQYDNRHFDMSYDEEAHQAAERIAAMTELMERTSVRRESVDIVTYKTVQCRRWFGQFVPIIRYPALWEVTNELQGELQRAQFAISQKDQQILSTVFVQVLEAVYQETTGGPSGLAVGHAIAGLRELLKTLPERHGSIPQVYHQLVKLLEARPPTEHARAAILSALVSVYREAIEERNATHDKVYRVLNRFRESVNAFLIDKSIEFSTPPNPRRRPQFVVSKRQPSRRHGLEILSSGERHVLTMLFSATHMQSGDGVVLIDEPELSLHVDWQREILTELQRQAGERQVLACTHSPEVAGEHRDRMIELHPEVFDSYEDEGRGSDEELF